MTRLVPVEHPRPGQTIRCTTCGRFKHADAMFADLEGPAFAAYICAECYIATAPPCAHCGFTVWPGTPHQHVGGGQ